MHHVTVTTTNDTGGVVATTGDVIAGHHTEAVAHAAYRARTATLRLHESSAPRAHHHLIAIDDDPITVITAPLTTDGHPDLHAALREINSLGATAHTTHWGA